MFPLWFLSMLISDNIVTKILNIKQIKLIAILNPIKIILNLNVSALIFIHAILITSNWTIIANLKI